MIKATTLWFERLVALMVLCNFLLVLFDTSYIHFRDFYLQYFPELTARYGAAFKGIEPERATENYLDTVAALNQQVAQTGLQSDQAQARLTELQELSVAMIDENPFEIANKSGTLERIKNLMRDRIGVDSAKTAFRTFWSQGYLSSVSPANQSTAAASVSFFEQELNFFQAELEPLMETNYFRGIGENGQPIDDFWKLDSGFVVFFAVELLARTFYVSRRYKNYTWLDAVLLRWYDLLLLLPLWRWLRIVPTGVRLNQSQLINLVPLRNRLNRIFITNFAVELTEVVVLRIIDQVQNLVQQGDIARWLLTTGSGQRYIDINGVNEIQAISGRLASLMVYQVLPKVKPELDALLHHSVSTAFDQAPGYQEFKQIPGIGLLPDQIARQVVGNVSQTLYQTLNGAIEDKEAAALTEQLLSRIGEVVRSEIQQDHTLEDLQRWTIALLEEVKINYVRQLSVEDVERLMEENYRIYNITQERHNLS